MSKEDQKTETTAASKALPSSEYRIETVEDFLKVPEDRIAECLEEFADFIEMSRSMLTVAKTMAEGMGVEDNSRIGAYTWVDDGKKDKTICLIPNSK